MEPSLLRDYRERLALSRANRPPFNPDRLRCQIESAYVHIWEIWCKGEKPHGFKVALN